MANKVNIWEQLLELANKDLKKYGVEMNVVHVDETSDYDLHIFYPDGTTEIFAENYYEDELGDLVQGAWSHARAKIAPQIVYRVSAYYDMDICKEEEILQEIYATEELAKARVAQLIQEYKEKCHTEDEAFDWTEREDYLDAYKDSEWNVEISWMPEPIRNKIN